LMSLGHGERDRTGSPVLSFSAPWLRLFGRGLVEALQQAKKIEESTRSAKVVATAGPVPSFSAPWLRLIGPVPVEALQRAMEMKKFLAPPEREAEKGA